MGKRRKGEEQKREKLKLLQIPLDFSVLTALRKQIKKEEWVKVLLQSLEETVIYYQIPKDMQEQTMESIQRASMYLVEMGLLQIARTDEPTEDEVSLHKLFDMVEHFHRVMEQKFGKKE